MKIARHASRWSAALASALALAGCGGTGDSPALPAASTIAGSVPGPAAPAEVYVGAKPPVAGHGPGEDFPPGPEFSAAAAQPDAPRVALDQAADIVRDGVQRTSAEVTQGAESLKRDATRAASDVKTQARQAAGHATAGVQSFADELKADAQQSYNDGVQAAKAQAQQAADSAKGQVRSAVDGAKAKARNQVKAAADSAQKSAADLGDKVLDNIFGSDSKAPARPN